MYTTLNSKTTYNLFFFISKKQEYDLGGGGGGKEQKTKSGYFEWQSPYVQQYANW